MDLSVAVVNWNTRDLLRQCLQSIYSTIQGVEYEVVVVDNGSVDGSVEMVTLEFPAVRVVANSDNAGFARGSNQAFQAGTGRHVLLLNSDAILVGDSARRMVEFLDTHREVGVVGGKLLNPDGSFQASYNDFAGLMGETLLLTGLSRWLLPSTYPSYPEARSGERRRVGWVGGALMMVRRAALDQVGSLDEGYFMYAEEMDWCYRMAQQGWAVYFLPEAQALHHGGASSRRLPEHIRTQLYRSKWRFLRKHRGRLRASLYRQLVRMVSAVKLAAWWSLALCPNAARRTTARRQVASYRLLLNEF